MLLHDKNHFVWAETAKMKISGEATKSQQKRAEAYHCIKKLNGIRKEKKDFAPVITPDVLCETDVEGGVVVFTIRSVEEELADVFGGFVRTICAFSLRTSVTVIVVST